MDDGHPTSTEPPPRRTATSAPNGLLFVLPRLSVYDFVRRVPQRVQISKQEAKALCQLSEDLRAHLFSHHPALLDRLLPEHRQIVLESIRGINQADQIPSTGKPSKVAKTIADKLGDPEAATEPVGALDHTIILAETLREVHEESSRLDADLSAALSAKDREGIKALLETSIWSKWFLSHVLDPFVDRFASEIAALGVDPELIRSQAESHHHFRHRDRITNPLPNLKTTAPPAQPPSTGTFPSNGHHRPPALPQRRPGTEAAGVLAMITSAPAAHHAPLETVPHTVPRPVPPPQHDLRAAWATTVSLGSIIQTPDALLKIADAQFREQRTARQCADGYRRLFIVIDAVEKAVVSDLATISVAFPRPRAVGNAQISQAHRHPLAELFVALAKNRREFVDFIVAAQATDFFTPTDPLRPQFFQDATSYGIAVPATRTNDPDPSPHVAPTAAVPPLTTTTTSSPAAPLDILKTIPASPPNQPKSTAPPASEPSHLPPIKPDDRAPLSSTPGPAGHKPGPARLSGLIMLLHRFTRRNRRSEKATKRRERAIRHQLIKAARRPSRTVQTQLENGTRGFLRSAGWAVAFFVGGVCFVALDQRLPDMEKRWQRYPRAEAWQVITPRSDHVTAYLSEDDARLGISNAAVLPVLQSGNAFPVLEDHGDVLGIAVAAPASKAPVEIWVQTNTVSRVR